MDDSALVRQTLRRELESHPEVEVVGAAPDPFVARDLIKSEKPEVIVLDLEMPRMDGLDFLRRIMAMHPLPVIICSSLSQKGSETALACLEAGAVEVFGKPEAAYSIGELGRDLTRAVLAARNTQPRAIRSAPKGQVRATLSQVAQTTNQLCLIGSSTGGPVAVQEILTTLPANMPPIVVVQHMPKGFTKPFAERLNKFSALEIREATHGELLTPGKVLIAPAANHLRVAKNGAQLLVEVARGPEVCYHKPSVEVLFESAAEVVGKNAMAVILTGMGSDGAGGMKSLRDKGAYTVAQDEASCVVFGMPKEAIAAGGACDVLPLSSIAGRMVEFAEGRHVGQRVA